MARKRKKKLDPSEDPSTKSEAWDAMAGVWDKVESILGGTQVMRSAGEKFLPKHEAETSLRYRERLEANTLFNGSEITLEGWTSRPFQNLVQQSEVAPRMRPILEDVDLEGNSITVFARRWFREGLAKAVGHVLVEFPIGTAGETLADDRAANKRPYWCFVKPENLIFASATMENGREILTHVRIMERDVSRVGFAESSVLRIRVYDRVPGTKPAVTVTLYELVEIDGVEEWKKTGEPRTLEGMDEIPLVTFYANRTDLMRGKPPLEAIVDLNIRWWQSNSDQISVLTVARFPILARSGADAAEGETIVGPKYIMGTTDPQGRVYYVEHSGKAIEAGRQDLQDLEEKMATYGAQFLKKRSGDQTATEIAITSAESTSQLKDAVVRFNDSLKNAVALTAKWMGIEEPGKVQVPTDFGPESSEAFDLTTLMETRRMREVSRKTYLRELKRRGLLSDDFDLEDDAAALAAEPVPAEPLPGKAAGSPGRPRKEDGPPVKTP